MAFWLFKTEPAVFSIEDLREAPKKAARWDEIRNYQARNYLRDHVQVGDQVFIYHSQCKPAGIVGLAQVVTPAYPDPSQFDTTSRYFDDKARADAPRWYCLDVSHRATFTNMVTLAQIKQLPELGQMTLLKQGRLSVQPISETEAEVIKSLANANASR